MKITPITNSNINFVYRSPLKTLYLEDKCLELNMADGDLFQFADIRLKGNNDKKYIEGIIETLKRLGVKFE